MILRKGHRQRRIAQFANTAVIALGIAGCATIGGEPQEACYRSLINPFIEISHSNDRIALAVATSAINSLGFVGDGQKFSAPDDDCFVALEWKSETVLVVARYRAPNSQENPYHFDRKVRKALNQSATALSVQELVAIGSEVKNVD